MPPVLAAPLVKYGGTDAVLPAQFGNWATSTSRAFNCSFSGCAFDS